MLVAINPQVSEVNVAEEDIALCGDPTCESPGCRQSAIDAWDAQMQENARIVVREALGLPV